MINLVTLHPERLNLNGDQGNLLVLSQRAKWDGVETNVLPVTSESGKAKVLDDLRAGVPTFLLIGHGSIAAMKSIEPEAADTRAWVANIISSGGCGLAVGSGYELLATRFTRSVRVSDYANVELEGFDNLRGYVNTDTDLPLASFVGESFLATMVHGPILARNPSLADFYLRRLGVNPVKNYRAEEVDALVEVINNR